MAQVLIVDDDRAIREMLRVALEVEGYSVRVLTDGREVIEALRGMSGPCVLLMDLMMPGVSGWDVCEALLADERLARHPLVVMTAGLMKGDSAPAPARTLLCKPFELDRVYAVVEALATEAAVAATVSEHVPATSVA
jgi:CheY-like chemotaxis protein